MKSREMRRFGHVTRVLEMRNACRISVGNPEGKIPLGRPRCRLQDAIRKYLR
jgi:hypothetical protein